MTDRPQHLLIVNPNATVAVTDALAAAVAPLAGDDLVVETATLAEGPPLIETDTDVSRVIPPLLDLLERRLAERPVDAVIIACFSDPGVVQARRRLPIPVLGIAESAYCGAMAAGGRFGVISIHPSSVARHDRHLDRIGFTHRRAGDRPVDLTDIGPGPEHDTVVLDRLETVGRALLDQDGADCVILGCAGLAGHRHVLADRLGAPVIDPTIAAVSLARLALQSAPPADPPHPSVVL